MLTKKFMTLTGHTFHYLCRGWASPFDWNFKLQRLILTSVNLNHFILTRLITSLLGVFMTVRTIHCKLNKDNNLFLVYTFVLMFLMNGVLTIVLIVYAKDVCVLYNALLDYYARLRSKSN